MKHIYIALAVTILTLGVLAADINDNAGSYGYQFLDISTNPVSLALAGRGIYSGADLAAYIRQPAAATINAHQSLGVSHSMWLGDTKYNNIYYSTSNRKSHFGLALRNLDYGELEIRDDNGFLIGYYSPLNMDLMANYALRITPSVYAGFNAGVAYEKLNTDSSLGVHTDLGVTLLPPLKNTQLSLTVRNLGLSSAVNNESTLFAPSFELDVSKGYDFPNVMLDVELSAIKAIDENWKAAVSSQMTLHDLVSLRAGYKINYDAESLSAGIGIELKNFSVDYGWALFTSSLNDVHSIGLSYNFK